MSEAFVELLFWIVVFLIFFFGFKWLQKRKEARKAQADTQTPHTSSGRVAKDLDPSGHDGSGGD